MSEVAIERDWWDSHSSDLDSMKRVTWAEDGTDYDARAVECAGEIAVRLGNLYDVKKVLDLGCGHGRLAIPLAQAFPSAMFYGVDISAGAITLAEKEALRLGVENVQFEVGDGRQLPKIPRMNAAYSMLCFQHLPHDAVAGYIVQVAGLLTKGSRFVFQHVLGDDDVFLCHQTSREQILEWLGAAGLEIVEWDEGVIFPTWVWVTAMKP